MNTAQQLEVNQMTEKSSEGKSEDMKLHQCNLHKDVKDWYKVYAKERKRLVRDVFPDAIKLFVKQREKAKENSGIVLYYSPTQDTVLQNVQLDLDFTRLVSEISEQDSISVRLLLHTALMRFYLQKSKLAKPSQF